MVTYQSQSNGYYAYKFQTALGAQATGTGAKIFRTTGSGNAGAMTKAVTASNEVRRDGQRSRGRHGSQKTSGTAGGELALGAYDDILEAIMRGTYSAADLTVTEATAGLTSITTTANTIVAAAGSWITAGFKVHDVWRLTNHATAGNNGKNLRIVDVTPSTLTVAETLVANATPDTAFTLTRPGRVLINPAAGALVDRYATWEEHEIDIDGSELFTDAVFGSGRIAMTPNGIITFEAGWTGTGRFETKTGAAAPFFPAPTENTATPMAVVDATLRLGSTDLVELTSFDLSWNIGPTAPDTFGSGAQKYSPDVFRGNMAVEMNLAMLRKDLAYVQSFANEEVLSLHVLAVDNEAEPKDFIAFSVPNFTLAGVDKSALNKEGGARTQTIRVPADLVGKDTRGSAYDPTMLKIQVSNAS
ncbi:phage tail tube protein [Bradyrhizobium sp. Arg237L]|uniref:phage tail tube protein n=1 Tax=Bradyrhizobium sp. Arg237L TaxID=3003352 RepID=UPI00249F7E9C|nr:phage tail tube protein [Bradyrhizobium sp. Arg237L]MDI4231451.1 phage tail tube protein [Bradyrhizobium sp. Arg237L]